MRSLERQLAAICRKAAKAIVAEERKRITVTEKNLQDFIGKRIFRYGQAETEDQVGVVTGLAYTTVGGDTLSIEVSLSPGKGKLILTGKLGDVMRESAQAHSAMCDPKQKNLALNLTFMRSMIFIYMYQRVRCQKMVRQPVLRWQQRLFLL
nr:hypothetical protein P5648_14935 [Bacillus subtilis]